MYIYIYIFVNMLPGTTSQTCTQVQGQPLLLAALVGATSLHPSLTESLHEAAVNASGQRRFKHLGAEANWV